MNDRQLRYALAVWQDRSFSRAAGRLGVSQPALSEQVRNLEAELGFALFDRTSRGVEPSTAGRTFLDEAADVVGRMGALEDLAHELRGSPETTFRVGLGSALAGRMVPQVVESMRVSNTRCRLELITATTRRVQRLVAQKRLDVGLIVQGATKSMPTEVCREPCGETEIVVAVPREHALAHTDAPATLAELAAHPLIMNEPRIGYGRATLDAFDAIGLTANIAAVSDDLESVKSMVACGAGVAIVPRVAFEGAPVPGSIRLRRLDPPQLTPLLLLRRDDPLSPRVEACIESLRLGLAG